MSAEQLPARAAERAGIRLIGDWLSGGAQILALVTGDREVHVPAAGEHDTTPHQGGADDHACQENRSASHARMVTAASAIPHMISPVGSDDPISECASDHTPVPGISSQGKENGGDFSPPLTIANRTPPCPAVPIHSAPSRTEPSHVRLNDIRCDSADVSHRLRGAWHRARLMRSWRSAQKCRRRLALYQLRHHPSADPEQTRMRRFMLPSFGGGRPWR